MPGETASIPTPTPDSTRPADVSDPEDLVLPVGEYSLHAAPADYAVDRL